MIIAIWKHHLVMDGITGSVLLLCLISLTTAQNTAPEITTTVYQLCEDIPPGHHAFSIDARDDQNDPLTYSLFGTDAGYFTVDEHTGNVTIKRSLSTETNDYLILHVEVSDNVYNTQAELTLILSRTNKNRPIFESPSYDTAIDENTPLNQTVVTVKADDIDSEAAGHEYYNITEVIPKEGSSLFSIGYTSGKVKLEGHLNYTSLGSFYRLKIRATDGGGKCYSNKTKFFWSEVYSFITVLDVPDLDPQFINGPYVIRVEENTPLGEPVFKVTAIDQDIGINDEITYSIEDSTASGLFNISSKEGIIYVKAPIDRETVGDALNLTVKATESKPNIDGLEASKMTNIVINIMDVNDKEPDFYKCEAPGELCELTKHFTGEVNEHSQGSVIINMTVKDPDLNSRTKLILQGADKDVFSVQPQYTTLDSAVLLLVKQPQLLDYERKHQMVVEVIAIDEVKPTLLSTATVTINILDINDNIPKFPRDVYHLNVTEHAPVGTVVDTITAEDNDTMDQGKITYSLLSDTIRLYLLDVVPSTGAIYVKNSTLLDRETRPLLSVTLEARDTRDTDIQGTTTLEITVIDINDKYPVFKRESYLVFVEEGGTVEVTIEATDEDDPDTVNSQIEYGIEQSEYGANFTINPKSGVLTNSGELDREAIDPSLNGVIKLNITATDKGTPPLSREVPVIINVEDINDNSPQFEASVYNFSVKEGEKGAFVGSVYAEDLDQTRDFNRISFSIIGSYGRFMIRTFVDGQGYRGNITVDPDVELEYESTRNQFKLTVEATDLEQKKAEATVDVYVLDVNDERPTFKPMAPVTVKENSSISNVGKFLGQDSDGNHSLVYELESIKCRCNSSLVSCDWFILDSTGDVRLNPKKTVDYEECDQVVIEAQVVDVLTEKGENNSATTGEMVINIEDINDNAPEFILSDAVFVVVSESASKGTSVAGVTAIDRDSEDNGKIAFKVTTVWFEDTNGRNISTKTLFEAITTRQEDIYVGIIQTTDGLEMSLRGKYVVTMSATDNGDLSSSRVLKIFTVDESYKVELQFTKSVEEVEQDRDKIIRSLTAATKASVEVITIRPDETSRASTITVMAVYFVYANGTALTSDAVEKMVSNPEHYPVLANLGLMYIGQGPEVIPDVDHGKFILLGMLGGLLIVVAVLTTSLTCTRRNYKRKLKAAKAMNSAALVTSDNDKGGAVVPGTNKYTMEGANPVLNLNMVLDLDEGNSDVDKVSLNSLDVTDDMTTTGGEVKMNMLMIEEEEEEDDDDGPPEYIEPLDAALAQRRQNKDKLNVGFVNAAFSVTDL